MGSNSNSFRAGSSASDDGRINRTDGIALESEVKMAIVGTVNALKPAMKKVKNRLERTVDEHLGKINK